MKTITLAIVDDQKMFCTAMRTVLEDSDKFRVVFEAANGKELLKKLEVIDILPDLILLDISMPEMDGVETQKLLSLKYPNLKTLALTMHDDYAMVGRMCELGVNGYVKKNEDLNELEKAITTIVEKGSYYSPEVGAAMQQWFKARNSGIPLIPELNEREIKILELVCLQYTTVEIAEQMGLKHRTLDGYRNRLIEKTHSKNTAGLVVFALKHQIVKL